MASGGSKTQSVLDKITQDHLECPICCSIYRQPKFLDCLHTFCLPCLQILMQSQAPQNTKLPCPLCRRQTTLKDNTVDNLPNNFSLSALVEEVGMQEKLLQGEKKEITCQVCDEQQPAVSRCLDCDHFLCGDCQKAHKRLSVLMKSHRIYTLAQLRSGEITYKSKLRESIPPCGQHPDQNLSFYCNTCEQLVCAHCAILDHAPPKHSLASLPQALSQCKQDIVAMSRRVDKRKEELYIAINEILGSHTELDSAFDKTNEKITNKSEKEISRIKKDEQYLKNQLQQIYNDRTKIFKIAATTNTQLITEAEHNLDKVDYVITQASCYEILDLKHKLLHNLDKLMTKITQTVTADAGLSFLDFDEIDRQFGELVLENKLKATKLCEPAHYCQRWTYGFWKLKKDIKAFSFARSVAVYSNSKIVILDYWKNQLLTILGNNDIPFELKIHNFTDKYLTNVIVNKSDQLIVLDRPAVKIFNINYQLLHEFKPGKRPKREPTCIAVNDKDVLAVGYGDCGKISLHSVTSRPS